MIDMQIKGIEEARQFLEKMDRNLQDISRVKAFIGSNLRYAYGIEYGVTRGGKLARRAGGAFMITNAIKDVRDDLKRNMIAAITGDGDIEAAVYRAALTAENIAKGKTPVRTGSLRRSIHTVVVR